MVECRNRKCRAIVSREAVICPACGIARPGARHADTGAVIFLFILYLAVTITVYDVLRTRHLAAFLLLVSVVPVVIAGFNVMIGSGYRAPKWLGMAIAIAAVSYFLP
jgi:uncharacterized protein (DUF983 family)